MARGEDGGEDTTQGESYCSVYLSKETSNKFVLTIASQRIKKETQKTKICNGAICNFFSKRLSVFQKFCNRLKNHTTNQQTNEVIFQVSVPPPNLCVVTCFLLFDRKKQENGLALLTTQTGHHHFPTLSTPR